MASALIVLAIFLLGSNQTSTTYQESGGFAAASPTRMEAGRYTSDARKADIKGSVRVAVVVKADGSPGNARVILGLGHGLDESALFALKHWRFRPRLAYGQPVESELLVAVPFDPSINPGP